MKHVLEFSDESGRQAAVRVADVVAVYAVDQGAYDADGDPYPEGTTSAIDTATTTYYSSETSAAVIARWSACLSTV